MSANNSTLLPPPDAPPPAPNSVGPKHSLSSLPSRPANLDFASNSFASSPSSSSPFQAVIPKDASPNSMDSPPTEMPATTDTSLEQVQVPTTAGSSSASATAELKADGPGSLTSSSKQDADASTHSKIQGDEDSSASHPRKESKETQPALSGSKILALEKALESLEDTIFTSYLRFVRFEVGLNSTPFVIHTVTLERRCPSIVSYVQKRGIRLEDRTVHCQVVRVQKTLVSTFRLFVTWVHTGRIASALPADQLEADERMPENYQQRLVEAAASGIGGCVRDIDLTWLYIFAVRQQIPDLANQALTMLFVQNERYGQTSSYGVIELLLEAFGESVEVLTLFIEEAASKLNAQNISAKLLQFPEAFVVRVVAKVLRDRDTPGKYRRLKVEQLKRICDFHQHHSLDAKAACRTAMPTTSLDIIKQDVSPQIHDLYCTTGTIALGSQGLLYTVHKGLISKHSTYFDGAFNSGFAEGKGNEVELKHEDIDDFSVFLDWLYRQYLQLITTKEHKIYEDYCSSIAEASDQAGEIEGALAIPPPPNPARSPLHSPDLLSTIEPERNIGNSDEGTASVSESSDDDEEEAQDHLDNCTLVDMFIFADRQGIPHLRNMVITRLIRHRKAGKPLVSADLNLLEIAFSNLVPSHSKLCQYISDEALHCWTEDKVRTLDLEEIPPAFSARLLGAFFRKKQAKSTPWDENVCVYHDHANDAEIHESEKARWAALST